MTIINASEVKAFSGVPQESLSTAKIAPFVDDSVAYLFLNSLSTTLLDAMVADMVDYSTVTAWAAGTYTIGQKCRVDGIVYEALKSTTNKPTLTATDWKIPAKFTTPCLEIIWLKLRRLVCLTVLSDMMGLMLTKLDDNGATRATGQNFEAAGVYHSEQLATSVQNLKVQSWALFMDWFKNQTACNYSSYYLNCSISQYQTLGNLTRRINVG